MLQGPVIRNATKRTSIQNTLRLWHCMACGWARFNRPVWGEWKYRATHSITSSVHGGERSASRTVRCIHIGRALRTHLFWGWVGVTADLAVSEKRNISLHLPRMDLRLFTIAGLSSPSIKSNEVILLLILMPNSHRLSSRTFTLCQLLFTGCTNFLCLDSSRFVLSIRTLLLR